MNISTHESLPLNIKTKLTDANIYYDAKYSDYECSNNCKVYYLYNDFFILPVTINTIKKIFTIIITYKTKQL